MSLSPRINRFRDEIRSYVVPWLSDRKTATPERTAGFRYLWSMVAPLDAAMDVLFQGIAARYPSFGTSTALPLIGRSRGLLRGQTDTDAEFAAKLLLWLEKWRHAGSQRQLAIELHEYLGNHPRVRVVNRAGHWVTVAQDGTVTETTAAWDWDSVSNPERAGYWSEMWIIIYPTRWAIAGNWGDGRNWGEQDSGLGHLVTGVEHDAVRGLIAQWKSAHSRVRTVIWTSDATLFDPAVPASCPDGTWGQWSSGGSGSRVASNRNVTTCRYWEL
jgi:hypothetical protein